MEIGSRIKIKLFSYQLTSAWDTPYGAIFLYSFKDYSGLTYIWKTSRMIRNPIKTVVGTISGFTEYNGEKEIQLKYCRSY